MLEIEKKLDALNEEMKRKQERGEGEKFRKKYDILKEELTQKLVLAAMEEYQREYYDEKKGAPENDNDGKPYLELN